MKLGIAVVYLLNEHDDALLDLHLSQIQQNTDVPFRLYACVNRLLPKFREVLEAQPFVQICDCPDTDLRGNAEHGYYLDQLVQYAVNDGSSHIATLDVDSFPIRPGWAAELVGYLTEKCILVAVSRHENGDTALPHPSGLLFSREFYLEHHPTFFPAPEEQNSRELKAFLQKFHQVPDTGIGYSFKMYQHQLSWHPLLRSNKTNDHYLLAGIYGDLIFHLGAASRRRAFRGDKVPMRSLRNLINRQMRRLNQKLRILVSGIRGRLNIPGDHRVDVFPGKQGKQERINQNEQIYQRIRTSLLKSPEAYIEHLRNDSSTT